MARFRWPLCVGWDIAVEIDIASVEYWQDGFFMHCAVHATDVFGVLLRTKALACINWCAQFNR